MVPVTLAEEGMRAHTLMQLESMTVNVFYAEATLRWVC